MKKSLSVLLATSFVVSAAHAHDGCKNPTTSYDQTYCSAKLFLESDKELNLTYSELTKSIKPDVKKSLVSAQKKWMKYRNDKCSESGTIYVSCNYDVNKARDTYLRDRLRECKTGHCQNDLIISTSFS